MLNNDGCRAATDTQILVYTCNTNNSRKLYIYILIESLAFGFVDLNVKVSVVICDDLHFPCERILSLHSSFF